LRPSGSKDDLKRRHKALRRVAEFSVGLMGRTPDYMNVTYAGFAGRSDEWAINGNEQGAANLVEFQKELRRDDLSLTHTLIHATTDKSKGLVPTGLDIDGNLPVYNSVLSASWRGNAHHQSMIRAWTKLELAWGLATCMAEAIGATDPVTQQMLGEICSYAELTKAAVHYGEDGAYEYGNGAWFLDHKPLDALRATLPFWFPRVNEIIRLIGSHNVLCTPTSAQFADLTFAPTDRQIPPRGRGHHGGGSRPHLPPRLGRACQPQRAV
jgi:aromatic ring hydroxylase